MGFRKNLYLAYKNRFFPHIRGLRGSHRILLFLKRLAAKGIKEIEEKPESIFDRTDWQALIILDACRHDIYEEVIGEEVETRISLGSTTTEYIERTFSEGDFSDIVYISANPFFSDRFLEKLVDRSDLFHTKFDVFQDGWNKEEGTVLPKTVADRAETAQKLFPEKKLIIHFIQPHYPFIGFNDEGFTDSKGWLSEDQSTSIWDRAENGDYTQEEVRNAYSQNLEVVLPHAEQLAEKIEGKTVITSDHGNLIGENGLYGHPDNMSFAPLRKVPWDVRE
ncbi:MAG: hypothetical protein ABEJ95_07455 [Candidatus Nanohalobium sp.]